MKNKFLRLILLATFCTLFILLLATTASANANKQLALDLESELMSPCGSGMTVAASGCPPSNKIRDEISMLIDKGMGLDEILNWMADSHGEVILANPRPTGLNLMAWIVPIVLGVAGIIIFVVLIRSWSKKGAAALEADANRQADEPIDEEYNKRLDAELHDMDS